MQKYHEHLLISIPIAWSDSLPWVLPIKFKWKLLCSKSFFTIFFHSQNSWEPGGGLSRLEGSKVNPLREELYNEQISSQGSTEGFITWTIQKKARYKEIVAFLVKQRPERKRRPRSATGGSGWPTCLIHPFIHSSIHSLYFLPACIFPLSAQQCCRVSQSEGSTSVLTFFTHQVSNAFYFYF